MRWRHAAAIVGSAGVEGVLAIDMEELFVSNALPKAALATWREFVDEPMAVLAELIHGVWGTGSLRLGIELDFLPAQRFQLLERLLPDVTWVGIDADLDDVRASKTATELDVVRRLSLAADSALLQALQNVSVGETEAELGEAIISALYSSGVSEHRFLIASSGSQTQYANAGPTDKRIAVGDLLRVEVFGGANGYQAGVARTAVMGSPSEEILSYWSYIRDARLRGLEMVRPGADPASIYAAYHDALGPLSKYAIAFFGHGMGLDMHEVPYISATSTNRIEEGAIIGIEPFAMVPGRFGFQVKDVVAVTADGYDVVSNRLDGGELFVAG
jgi:Xaa-Pro aminopeptidase